MWITHAKGIGHQNMTTMIKMAPSSNMKSEARDMLLGKYGTLIGALIIQFLLVQVLDLAAMFLFGNLAVYTAAVLLIALLSGVLYSGRAYMYMNVIYGQPVSVSDLFYGIRENADKAILLQIPFAVLNLLVQIPYVLYESGIMTDASLTILLTTLFMVLYILINIFFGQSYFLLQDFPDRSAKDLLLTSARLMKHHVWRYIHLYLSFIPLVLLGIVTLFVPLLWVECYAQASLAAFYKELISNAAKEKTGI